MEDAQVPDMTRLEFTLRKPRKDTDISSQILDVLTSYLQPGSITAPQIAAESIDELTPQRRRDRGEEPGPVDASAEELEEFLWELWAIVYDVATQIPHSHPAQDKLVSLLRELKALENPISVTVWGNETQLWTTLPLLGPALREIYDTDLNTCNPDEELEAWLSRESFLARLHAAGVQDLTKFAVWSMTEALERDAYQSAKGKNILRRVATQWIIYAGPKLYAFAQKGEQHKDFLQITKPGPAYDGAAGLPLERWMFWKRRFGEESEDEKIKQVATRMQEIEDGEA